MISGVRGYIIAGAGGLAVALACYGAIKFYGNVRDRQGYERAVNEQAVETARLAREYREREIKLQVESDEKVAQAQKQVREQRDIIAGYASDNDGLRKQIAAERSRTAEDSKRAGRNVAKDTRAWDVLAECEREYTALVADVEQLIADFWVTQSWASVVDPAGAKRHGYDRR